MNNSFFIILLFMSLINYNDCIKNLPSSSNKDFEKINKSRKMFGKEIISENSTEANFIGAVVHVGRCCDYERVAMSNELKIVCVVSIINEYYVLASGYCLETLEIMNETNFIIIFDHDPLGQWRLNYDKEIKPFEYRSIKEIKIHEKYDRFLKYDIGLMRMDKPLDFTKTKTLSKGRIPYISSFRPYCRENYEVDVTDVNQRKCNLYMYGHAQNVEESHNELLKRLHVSIMEPRDCRNYYSHFYPKQLICAGNGELFPKDQDRYFHAYKIGEIGGPLLCVETNFKNYKDFSKHQVVGIANTRILKRYVNPEEFEVIYFFSSLKFFGEWIADNSELN